MRNKQNMLSIKDFILEKRTLLLNIFLLFFWAFFQYKMGFRFFGLFIILFVFFLLFVEQKNSILLIIPVLVILIFGTHILDTLTDLRKTDAIVVQYHGETLKKVFTPNSGLEVLPAKVQDMLSLLNENNVNSYQLSAQITNENETYQRIIESAWPRKLSNTSKYILIAPDEIKQYSSCNVIDQREGVSLVYCH